MSDTETVDAFNSDVDVHESYEHLCEALQPVALQLPLPYSRL
jgi:hypothetical protein